MINMYEKINLPCPRVSIIILNWNGKDDTIECLESLKYIIYSNYEVLLVDNGSVDGSVELFRERYPGIEIIENKQNLGFAGGCNRGIKKAMDNGADYVLLLNNDTIVDKDFLTELVRIAEESEGIGVVGPKIYQYENKEKLLLSGAKILFWKAGLLKGYDVSTATDVDMISGCCMLIKRETISSIGMLDSTYFFGWEDSDFCVTAKKKGYRVVCAPKSRIYHKVGGSYGGHYANNPTILTEGIRNQLIFISRHASFLQKLSSILFMFPHLLLVIFWRTESISDIKTRVMAIVKGIINYRIYKKTLLKSHNR